MSKKKSENHVSRIKYTEEQIEEFNKNNPGKEIDKYGNVYTEVDINIPRKVRKYDILSSIGRRFGRLIVLKVLENRDKHNRLRRYLKCECTCRDTDRNIIYVRSEELFTGGTVSCGCIQKEKVSAMHYENLVGKRFGELDVLEECKEKNKFGFTLWKCKCSCGKSTIVDTHSLKSGHTQSCGHIRLERARIVNTKHGDWKSRLYRIWRSIKDRCNNPNCPEHRLYYDKGIKICDEWKDDYLVFKKWSLDNNYNDSKTIDRIDSNKGYNPDNCRWVDLQTQCCNTSNNVITIDCYVPADLFRLANISNKKGACKIYSDIKSITIRDVCDRLFGEGNGYELLPQVVRHHTPEFVSEMNEHLSKVYDKIHNMCYPKNKDMKKLRKGICTEWLMNRRKFIDWAINNGYYKDYKIGLIDPNKDYSPDNCFIDYSRD